ncbi:hypothetical protein RJ641_026868 [Dillenia turbinata]|uniref:BHLH domain-containing protein n=1 Tax=Dillenia turbinata TaxID=194707 RepID=A0AAN8ZKS7_9MAGN
MNRGVLQSSPVVQQMMAGSPPNWWSVNNMRAPTPPQSQPHPNHQYHPNYFNHPPSNLFSPYLPTSSLPMPPWHDNNNQDQLPESWSQLLLGGLVGEEDQKGGLGNFQARKLEKWEEEALQHQSSGHVPVIDHVKQENSTTGYMYVHDQHRAIPSDEFQPAKASTNWSQIMPSSSTKSCVTSSFSSSMLDFSATKGDISRHDPQQDRSSECNSTASGGAVKKARVQPSSNQSTFKVRKEKLGDRITALHQLVSPFGKALSLPYMGSGSSNVRQQQSVQGERNGLFPEDPGQLLNDNSSIKRKGGPEQDSREEPKKDLRSRGLCLVPVSCTLQVGSDNGADYWAPALGGGFR